MQLKSSTRRFVGWFSQIRHSGAATEADNNRRPTCSRCGEYDWLTRRCRIFGGTRPEASCNFWECAA